MTRSTLPDLNALPLPELFRALCRDEAIERLLTLARDEDLGCPRTDVTTWALDAANARFEANVVARQPGVVSGLATIPMLLSIMAPACVAAPQCSDGNVIEPDQPILRLAGPIDEIVALERTLLNLLGRLSGVATNTADYVRAIEGTSAHVYDTRKTTPGLRSLEKYAVRCGGGRCHRLGLHDAVLLKDNHIADVKVGALTGRLTAIATRARSGPPIRFVEVEVDSLAQLDAALAVEPGLIDIVLLDNFTPADLKEAVKRRDASASKPQFEASGGVTLDSIRAIAETGVERISSGALTHGATWLDFGLDAAT